MLKPYRSPRHGRRRCRPESLESRLLLSGSVVINEIHYDPPNKTEPVQFVELTNPGDASVDLSGAAFTSGIKYTFAPGTTLAPGGYLVVAQNPSALRTKFGANSVGPWSGNLGRHGDDLIIRDAAGNKLDEVNYGAGFPWPTVGIDPGSSIELINPNLDNNVAGNWRSEVAAPQQDVNLISQGSTWDYRKGTSEASNPTSLWRQPGFVEDSTWATGPAPVGYDPSVPMGTTLYDMMQTATQPGYSSVFLRKTFNVSDPSQFATLRLDSMWDDGFNLWINGQWVAGQNVPGQEMTYNQFASSVIEDSSFHVLNLPDPRTVLVPGNNVIAVQFFNGNLTSSDAFFDCNLIATTSGGAGPTPGRLNASFAANAAPAIHDLDVNPAQPAENQPVTIAIKAGDPDGVANVSLQYQLVDPGNYISYDDAAYKTNWTSMQMHDDGQNGDAVAGDGKYTVVLPASFQVNRRLVRYRITATDGKGASITAPYADDPQRNFAYFVYNGNPAWTGSAHPGVTPPVTFSADLMNSVPNYTLIAKQTDAENATWYSGYQGSDYPWHGTIVYNGAVYDNVAFRPRGGVWRFAMGKNAWKFNFNHGHDIPILDNYGNPFPEWGKVNLRPLIQQQDTGLRGEQGLFESATLKLMQLAGVPTSNTAYVQLRIIDKPSQDGTSQYTGDLWGLYLAVENYDSHFESAHNLPSGNLYDMQPGDPGGGTLQAQGQTEPSDNSDLVDFTNTYRTTTPTDQWWQQNLDLPEYYSYRAVVEAVHHYDIDQGAGKNYEYYHYPNIPGDPLSGKWMVFPWDTDLTWADWQYGGGDEPFRSRVLPRATFSIDYKNRVRELRDLLYNPEQTGQLIDEIASKVYTPGQPSFVNVDRDMWDYNPTMIDPSKNTLSYKAGQGFFYTGKPRGVAIPAPGGFGGMIQYMKNYILHRGSYMDNSIAADPNIPATPSVGGAGSTAVDNLRFQTSNYSGANPFASMEWRIAEVTDPTDPAYDPKAPKHYEIQSNWDSGELSTFNGGVAIPANVVSVGHTYRVRVRMKDSTGRWSHWSNPDQFIATAPKTSVLPQSLRVTELNYDPAAPPAGSPYQADDFEFLELANFGTQPVNFSGAQFTDGITYTFGDATLAPGQAGVLVKNLQAFQSRYGTNALVLGTYGSSNTSFSNSGEHVRLADPFNQTIADFAYSATWYPATAGQGATLEVVDPVIGPDLNQSASWRAGATDGSPGTTPALSLTAPSAATVLQATTSQIKIQWADNSAGESAFKVFRATGANTFALVATLPANATTYTDTNGGAGFTASSEFVYRIQAYDANSFSAFAEVTANTPDPAAGASINLTASGSNGKVSLVWVGAATAASYRVYRGTSAGGEGSTPIATGLTTASYTDMNVASGGTYYYVVTTVDAAGQESGRSNEVSVLPPLGGTIIGTDGSWHNVGDTRDKVFDGDLNSFFDAPDPGNGDWVGLDLGAPYVITQVAYAPRPLINYRMVGGLIQGSNTPDFSTATTLFTVTVAPLDGVMTNQTISNPAGFRYVRYLAPDGGYGNIAELQFFGHPAAPPRVPGDANGDSKVDFSDLLILAQHYGVRTGATFAQGDFTGDGAVDFSDLLILAQHYGSSAASPASALADAVRRKTRQKL